MKLNYNAYAVDITPVPYYDEESSVEVDKIFHFQGNSYRLSKFTRVSENSIMGQNCWHYFFILDLYSSLVIRKYSHTDMIKVALVEIPKEDLSSLIEQLLFGGSYEL